MLRVSAGRAAEMSLANFVVHFGLFVTIYIRSRRADLTEDLIFSSVQLLAFLHIYNFQVIMSISSIIEIKVMIKRFLTIYNIKN